MSKLGFVCAAISSIMLLLLLLLMGGSNPSIISIDQQQREQQQHHRILRARNDPKTVELKQGSSTPLNPQKQFAILSAPEQAVGTKMWVHNILECIYISRSLVKTGYWEPFLQKELIESGPPGLFVDIGANIGTFSLVLAAAGYKVEAFEPMEYNLELFRLSIQANSGFSDRITIHEVAVGDTPIDKVCLTPAYAGTPTKNLGNGQITTADSGTGGTNCVPLVRPDSLTTACPDVVKVDVEGWEGPAIRGLGIPLTCRPRMIVHEYIDIYAKEDPFVILGDYYTCYFMSEKTHLLEPKGTKQRNGEYVCKLKRLSR